MGTMNRMPPTPARERVLDAYEALLADGSERAATLDAVARQAGVSKGGLLYHFGSKESLVAGLTDRMLTRLHEDLEELRASDEGVVAAFLRDSCAADTPFDRTMIAVATLAQAAIPSAQDALAAVQDGFYGLVLEAVGDPLAARAIVLMSDGLYFDSALLPGYDRRLRSPDVDELIRLVDDLVALRRGA
jgi:AcrR family transcriptional regulator